MSFLWDGVRQAVSILVHGNAYTYSLLWVTLKVAAISTASALLLGLPIGLMLGFGRRGGRRSRGARGLGSTLGNAGLGLPPVVVGLVLSLLMLPKAPLGDLRLYNTLKAMYIAQTLLSLPIVAALTASAVRSLPAGLPAQARLYGASTAQLWILALREARVGILAAVIAALGSALSEVGALVLVGGNLFGSTQTLATATLAEVNAGAYSEAMAIGIVLMGLILILAALLTVVQLGAPGRRNRAQAVPRYGTLA